MKILYTTILIVLTMFNTTTNKIEIDYGQYVDSQSIVEFVVEKPKDYITIVHEPCSLTSTFKSYMDYRTITNKSSAQYKLQQDAYTQDGYRMVDDRVMIAIANFKVGDKLDIHLSSGEILKTIVGDIKGNTSCAHPDGSIVEFIVDTNDIPKEVKLMGSFNVVHKGTVNKIEEIKGVS